jgi:hypothetical protein
VCQAPKLDNILEKTHKIIKNGVGSSQKNWEIRQYLDLTIQPQKIPMKRKELMEKVEGNKSPTNSTRICWLERDLECGE